MSVTRYITQEGDRWDIVSFKHYGRATEIKTLIRANRRIPKTGVIATGTALNIPILERPEVDTNLLPPWKRL